MESDKTKEQKADWKKGLILYLHDLIRTLMLILLIFLLVFRVIVVSGDSMYTTLYDGDYLLLLSNLFYQEPKQGDIIVVSKKSFDNGAPIVKRVIATEGQVVDIDSENGVVYVDDKPLSEDYTRGHTAAREGIQYPLLVEKGCIFALGDNRGVSKDSRSPEIGLIDNREILGKAIFLFLPGTHHNELTRDFDRIGAVQ